MANVVDRRVQMGGATRSRGVLGGARSGLEWSGLICCVLASLSLLVGGSLSVLKVVVAVLGAVVSLGAWTPWPGMQERSAVVWAVWWLRFLARRRRAKSVFALARDGRAAVPANLASLNARQGASGRAIVRDPNPGGRAFQTVAWEMVGARAGFDNDYMLGADQERYGKLAAAVITAEPRVVGLQQVSRVGSYDMADHVHWIAGKIPTGTNQRLIDSYINLLDIGGEQSDQTRTWLVARIRDGALVDDVADDDEDQDLDGEQRSLLSVEQIADSVSQIAALQGIQLRALSGPRLAAVIRGLQDPDHPLDQTAAMTWDSAWAPWETWHARHMVVHGSVRRWWTRTAILPADAVAPGALPADFLWPLIGSMTPTLVRTISTHIELIPAAKARGTVRDHVTADAAAEGEAAGSTVDDGAADQQLSLSQQHLVDLAAGSGHHGAAWVATVTIQAPSLRDLERATKQLRSAAEEAAITRLDFVDGWHEGAFCTTLPLAHGMGKAR
jgi:hypothetical protein